MATKAERHRWEQERAKPDKPKQPRRKRRDTPLDAATPSVGGTDYQMGGAGTAARNLSAHAAKKATYALEDSATGRPSRKSSRRAKNRAKPNSNLTRRRQREVHSPEARATQAAARKR